MSDSTVNPHSDDAPRQNDALAASRSGPGPRVVRWTLALASLALLVVVFQKVRLWDTVETADGRVLEGTIQSIEPRANADGSDDPDGVSGRDARPDTDRGSADGSDSRTGGAVAPGHTDHGDGSVPAVAAGAGTAAIQSLVIVTRDGATVTLTGREIAVLADGRPAVYRGFVPIVLSLPAWAFAAFAGLYLTTVYVLGLRWRALARVATLRMGAVDAFKLHLVGAYYASTLPAGMAAGDVIKALYLRRNAGATFATTMVTVVADRMIGLLTMVWLGVGALLLWRGGREFTPVMIAMASIAGVLSVGYVITVARGFSGIGRRASRMARVRVLRRFLAGTRRSTRLYRGRGAGVARAMPASVAGQLTQIAMAAVYGGALGVPVLGIEAYCIIVPAIAIIQSIPGLPGGWGLGEGAYVAAFALYGVSAEYALALSVLLRTSVLLMSLLGLWFALTLKRELRDEAAPATSTTSPVQPEPA